MKGSKWGFNVFLIVIRMTHCASIFQYSLYTYRLVVILGRQASKYIYTFELCCSNSSSARRRTATRKGRERERERSVNKTLGFPAHFPFSFCKEKSERRRLHYSRSQNPLLPSFFLTWVDRSGWFSSPLPSLLLPLPLCLGRIIITGKRWMIVANNRILKWDRPPRRRRRPTDAKLERSPGGTAEARGDGTTVRLGTAIPIDDKFMMMAISHSSNDSHTILERAKSIVIHVPTLGCPICSSPRSQPEKSSNAPCLSPPFFKARRIDSQRALLHCRFPSLLRLVEATECHQQLITQ